MSTRSIRSPDELKASVGSAAVRASFSAEADARFAKLLETGQTILWTDMRVYIEERLRARNT